MKVAEAVVSKVTGGRHLSREQKERGGPVVHFAFGGATGARGLAEIWPGVRAGFGTVFASALFSGADMIVVPVLRLGPSPDEQPATAQASPLAALLVYGLSTEAVRRLVRSLLSGNSE